VPPETLAIPASVEMEDYSIDIKELDAEWLGTTFERPSSKANATSRLIVKRMNAYRHQLLDRAYEIGSTV
jgi:hypothetical protein